MFVLPPQSPDFPVIADASNDVPSAMSRKSTFDQVIVAPLLVIVQAVPSVLDWTSSRFVTLFPVSVKVPVTVWSADNDRMSVLAAVPVYVRFVNVLVPLMEIVPPPVKTTVPL